MAGSRSGRITVQRSTLSGRDRWSVFIDGDVVEDVRAGSVVSRSVRPGSHLVSIKTGYPWADASVSVDVAAGKEVVIVGTGLLGGVRLRARLEAEPSKEEQVARWVNWRRKPREKTSATEPARHLPELVRRWRVIEEGRRDILLGEPEVRVIDNTRGTSPVVRTFRISREWTRSWSLDTERQMTAKGGLSLPLATLKAEAEMMLKQRYGSTGGERHTYEDSVVVTSAPHTRTTVRFLWREIRLMGSLELCENDAVLHQIPFEGTVGLSFDQQQIDE
jgi:hypothetical protein